MLRWAGLGVAVDGADESAKIRRPADRAGRVCRKNVSRARWRRFLRGDFRSLAARKSAWIICADRTFPSMAESRRPARLPAARPDARPRPPSQGLGVVGGVVRLCVRPALSPSRRNASSTRRARSSWRSCFALFRAAETGRLRLSDRLHVRNRFRSQADGIAVLSCSRPRRRPRAVQIRSGEPRPYPRWRKP